MVLEKRKPLLAYALSIVYILIVAITYNSLNPYIFRVGVWVSVIGFGAWLLYIYRSNTPLRYPRILLPIGAYLLLRFLATTQAPFPIISLEVVLRELILLFGFVFVFNSLDLSWKIHTWENALINFALVFCLIELALAYFWHRSWVDISGSLFPLPPVGYRSPGVFLGHPNILAGFLNLIAPIMVVRLIQESSWGKRAMWGLGLILFIPTLYFTSSRTGLIAGIFGVGMTLLILFVPNVYSKLVARGKRSLWEIIPRRVFFISLLALVIVVSFVAIFLIQSQRISTHAPTLISARSGIWGPALEIISEAPILGHGPGSFSVFFAEETQIPPGFATSHAHNLLLQTAAETGVIGVGILIWIIVGVIIEFLKIWKGASAGAKHRLAAYAGAGLALLSHHTLDYLFESPPYALSVFILFALALSESPTAETRAVHNVRAALIPGAILVVFLVGSTYTMTGASDYWDGVSAGRDGDWETAADEICRAYEKRPEISLYGFQCSLAHAQLYYRGENPQELQSALSIQREALEKDPYWPIHWANLAALEWENGDYNDAVRDMQHALDRAPRNPTIALNLAWMEEAGNRQEKAISAFVQALTADPWLQFGTSFQKSPKAQVALNRYLDTDDEDLQWKLETRAWIKLGDGQWQNAREIFLDALQENATSDYAYVGLGMAQQLLDQNTDATTNSEMAIFLGPSSPLVFHTAGVIADTQGRDEDARSYYTSAFTQIEEMTYSSSFNYRTYYRFFLPSDLVPQMWRGGLTHEMVDSFYALAEYYEGTGESEMAEGIRMRIAVEERMAVSETAWFSED